VFLVAAFASAGVWLSSGSSDTIDVLAARTDVARGEVFDAADLRVVEIPADAGLAVIAEAHAVRLVGQVATSDVTAGSLVTFDAIAATDAVGPDDAIVGLALPVGRYPSASLSPGDAVRVVRQVAADATSPPAVEVLIPAATVVVVSRPGSQGDVLVSLAMPIAAADTVAAAAAQGQVSLLLVAPEVTGP
jgi:hypothetical protein